MRRCFHVHLCSALATADGEVVQVQMVQVQVVAGAVAAWRWPVGGMPTCARKCAPGIGHADLAAGVRR